MVAGAGRRRKWGVTANGDRVSLRDYKNIIKVIVVMVTKLCEYTKITELYTFDELYLKKIRIISLPSIDIKYG